MTDGSVLLGFLAIGLVLVLVALLIVLIARPIANRLPNSPVVEYAPPDGDVVAHGLLLRADRRVFAAVLVDLAVRGKVRILAPRGRRGPVAIEVRAGASISPDERFLLQTLRPAHLRPRQERRYLRALVEIGIPVTRVEDAPDLFFLRGPGAFRLHRRRALPAFFDAVRERMRAEGLVRRGTVGVHLLLLSLLFLAVLVGGAVLILGALVNGEWLGALVVLADLAAIFWVLTLSPPPLLRFTAHGDELRRRLAGLRDYIRLGEQDRLRMLESPDGALRTAAGALTPGGQALGLRPEPMTGDVVAQSSLDRYVLLERLLPYAVLFRQERSWQREFAHLGDEDLAQNMRALGRTLEGVMTVIQVLVIIGQVLHTMGLVLSLLGRGRD